MSGLPSTRPEPEGLAARWPGPAHTPAAKGLLQGVVERVTYRHPDSGYTVLKISPERGYGDPEAAFTSERATAVGAAPELAEGTRVRLAGEWTLHPAHGRQLQFDAWQVLPPLDADGLVRYLASSAFRGVGPKLARRIVERLGPHALARIREDPAALEGVPGLGRKVRAELVAQVRAELGLQELHAFLLGAGLGAVQAQTVARHFGRDCESAIRENPYLLARGVPGVGFHTADRVALKLGLAADAPERREAGLLHALARAASDGHVLLERDALLAAAAPLLDAGDDPAGLDGALARLAGAGEVVVEEPAPGEEGGPAVYLPMYHACETRLAARLHALLAAGPAPALAGEAELCAAERALGIELHPSQRAAVLGLLREPVALLTGGPGVGKTTLVRLVVALAEAAGARVLLASPTGRAAKRLAEASGHEASTIHRLLGFEPRTGRFAHGTQRPLEAELLVVDEISMLDLVLAHHLVKAVRPPTRLVLVGDPDQLPSVSAGNVLADLIASGRIPVQRLEHVFRQEKRSLIVRNAHRILRGEPLELPERDDPPADFFFFGAEDEEHTARRLVEVVAHRIPSRFGMDWVRDVQVLAPMYRGACGVDALNERLRAELGARGPELLWKGRVWRVGDRVIHTRNDYEKEVFNGDMGRVASVLSDASGLVVRYPEREVGYGREELSDLQPAFAITVHRSQGGEFPGVVMPLVPQHWLMLQRHLLYTAVTRARRLLVLVGSRRALRMALENAEQRDRKSRLARRLRDLAS